MGTNQQLSIQTKLLSTPVLNWCGVLFAAFHIHSLGSLNTKDCINNWLPWKQISPNVMCPFLLFLIEAQKAWKDSHIEAFNEVIIVIAENNSSDTFLPVSKDSWKIHFFPFVRLFISFSFERLFQSCLNYSISLSQAKNSLFSRQISGNTNLTKLA